MSDPAPDAHEQLRRLKNTVMGAGYRLGQLARSQEFTESTAADLRSVSSELTQAAQRLERLLAALRRDR